MNEKFPHGLRKVYWDGGGVCARGVFASTVGINETTIRQYARHQGEQETGHAQMPSSVPNTSVKTRFSINFDGVYLDKAVGSEERSLYK